MAYDRKCKRIIDGKTYNTETSTQIGGWRQVEDLFESGTFLYQTRFGAFFTYTYLSGLDEEDYDTIEPLLPDQAREWLEKNQAYDTDLIEKLFGEMPEAGSGEIKFTLRLPESLRDRLAERAKANSQSLNAWMVRCLENCASPDDASKQQPKRRGRLL
jgi:hypothetical protein